MRISDWSSDVCSSDLPTRSISTSADPARRSPDIRRPMRAPVSFRSRSLDRAKPPAPQPRHLSWAIIPAAKACAEGCVMMARLARAIPVLLLVLCGPLPWNAAAGGEGMPSAVERGAIRQVIEGQIAAFQRGDGNAAFAYASHGIQAKLGER